MKTITSKNTPSTRCYLCERIKKSIKEKKKIIYRSEKRQNRRLQPYI